MALKNLELIIIKDLNTKKDLIYCAFVRLICFEMGCAWSKLINFQITSVHALDDKLCIGYGTIGGL